MVLARVWKYNTIPLSNVPVPVTPRVYPYPCLTLDTPPVHKLFDPSAPKISPVLQCRIDNEKAKDAVPAVTAPVINFNIGKDLVKLFHPCQPTVGPAATPPRSSPCALVPSWMTYDLQCPTLLQANWAPGINMPIADFCSAFELMDSVKDKLIENKYFFSHILRFVTVKDLDEMNFRNGEIAM